MSQDKPRIDTMYCQRRKDGSYRYFYPSPFVIVSLCGAEADEIAHVEVKEDPEGLYWAWWKNKEQGYSHVYGAKLLVGVCSPDYFRSSIKNGEGDILRVTITELKDSESSPA